MDHGAFLRLGIKTEEPNDQWKPVIWSLKLCDDPGGSLDILKSEIARYSLDYILYH